MNNPIPTTPTGQGQKNLLDTVANMGDYKTFGKAVAQSGLSETLNGQGPYTLFVPTDAAFSKLPSGQLDRLMKPENKDELASVLNYHVVNGRRSKADVGKWEAARTVNGQPAPIRSQGDSVSIDGAQINIADIASSNGVIHGIDKVNIPTAK